MAQDTQDTANLATVRRDGDPSVIIAAEHRIKHRLASIELGAACLCIVRIPQLVVLREATFDLVGREEVVDVGLVTTSIAGVNTDAFAEKLLNSRHERVIMRQGNV